MSNEKNTPKFVFFGAGIYGRSGLQYAQRSGLKVDHFVDNNCALWGQSINNVPILPPDVLREGEKCAIIVTVSYEYYSEIRDQLTEMGFVEHIDFWNFRDIFKPGNAEFGMTSGVVDLAENMKMVKTLQKNKLFLDASRHLVYRFISADQSEAFREIFHRCKEHHFFEKYLVPTALANCTSSDGYPLSLQHDYVPLFSYAVEWTPKMFYDYTLFMIDFLADLDSIGLGWTDAHAFNATFHKGKFVFFDFDAIGLGKTHSYYIQEFIDTHLLILKMMEKNMLPKVYYYLSSPSSSIMPSIRDISGYLSPEEAQRYETLASACRESALNGDIQSCCAHFKAYAQDIQMSYIWDSGWNGYQNELYARGEEAVWSDKQRAVIGMIRSVKPKTLLDLAGNMGWYEFAICREVEHCIVADLDYNCVDYVYQTVMEKKIENIYPVYLNLVTPTPAYYKDTPIGDTAITPWRKSAIDRFRSEMVLALAVVHHLAFSQQLSFEEIIGQFSLYTSRWLLIEFMEREDSVVAPALKNKDFDWYTQENFERVLCQHFQIISSTHSEPTRILYLCEKIQ